MAPFARLSATCLILLISGVPATAEDPFLLQSVEEKYSSDVAKADAAVAKVEAESVKAKKIAGAERLKAYKDRLVEVTKSGDFNKALAVKARVDQLEKQPEAETEKAGDSVGASIGSETAKRSRPKDTVRFNGHTYAFIRTEKVTWHVAKRRCEEMGGHLVCVNSVKEEQFVMQLCGTTHAWVGATDEEEEGKWYNVDGSNAIFSKAAVDNSNGMEHWLCWDGTKFNDWFSGGRCAYVCEWNR
jgi:hypothetical protein